MKKTGPARTGLAMAAALAIGAILPAQESPAPVPQSAGQLWSGYDPLAEPLDVETVREWEDGGTSMRYLRYAVGELRGDRRKAKPRMAAYYGFPRGGAKLPAILHLHGGGQSAQKDYVKYWTTLGYAAMSINWGEKPVEGPDALNTEWDGLAAGFLPPTHHNDVSPGPETLFGVPHPLNSSWILYAMAARRALTFLQRQPEVDPDRLGLTGHSMGGRLTVLSAVDGRVKAAVPSVGGSGFLYDDLWGLPGSGRHMKEDLDLYNHTLDCRAYWPRIQCPVLFLGSTNDFNSPTELVVKGMGLLPHDRSRLILAPHLNHRFTDSTWVGRALWFETHLKGNFRFPGTSPGELILTAEDGVPRYHVRPDASTPHPVVAVDIYYGYDRDPRTRFWRHAEARRTGDSWEGRCPVFDPEEPLFAFANVTYRIDRKVKTPPGYSPEVDRLTIAGTYRMAYPEDLKAAGVKATGEPGRLIDDFANGFRDWMCIAENNPHHYYFGTRKIADPAWTGPKDGKLSVEVRTTAPGNVLGVVIETNTWRSSYTGRPRGTYIARAALPGTGPRRVTLAAGDFRDDKGAPLPDWDEATELGFTPGAKAAQDQTVPPWKGEIPQFRDLRWEGGVFVPRPEPYLPKNQARAFYESDTFRKEFQKAIQESVEREDQDRKPDRP